MKRLRKINAKILTIALIATALVVCGIGLAVADWADRSIGDYVVHLETSSGNSIKGATVILQPETTPLGDELFSEEATGYALALGKFPSGEGMSNLHITHSAYQTKDVPTLFGSESSEETTITLMPKLDVSESLYGVDFDYPVQLKDESVTDRTFPLQKLKVSSTARELKSSYEITGVFKVGNGGSLTPVSSALWSTYASVNPIDATIKLEGRTKNAYKVTVEATVDGKDDVYTGSKSYSIAVSETWPTQILGDTSFTYSSNLELNSLYLAVDSVETSSGVSWSIAGQQSLEGASLDSDDEVASLTVDTDSGRPIIAISRSGFFTLQATKAGSGRYQETTILTTITVERAARDAVWSEDFTDALAWSGGQSSVNATYSATANVGDDKPVYSVSPADISRNKDNGASIDPESGYAEFYSADTYEVKASFNPTSRYLGCEIAGDVLVAKGIRSLSMASTEIAFGSQAALPVVTDSSEVSGHWDIEKNKIEYTPTGSIQISGGQIVMNDTLVTDDSGYSYITATVGACGRFAGDAITAPVTISRSYVTDADYLVAGQPIDSSVGHWYNLLDAPDGNLSLEATSAWTRIGSSPTVSTKVSDFVETIGKTAAITSSTSGPYLFYLAKDNSEVSALASPIINFDKDLPQIGADDFGTGLDWIVKAWDEWVSRTFNKEKIVLFTASDKNSGVKSVYAYEQKYAGVPGSETFDRKSDFTPADEDWVSVYNASLLSDSTEPVDCKYTIDLPTPEEGNKRSVLYVKVVDVAGNSSIYTSNGYTFDRLPPAVDTKLPTAEVILPEEGVADGYNRTIDWGFKVEDPETNGAYSAIKSIEATVSGTWWNGSELERKNIIIKGTPAPSTEPVRVLSRGLNNSDTDPSNVGAFNFTIDGKDVENSSDWKLLAYGALIAGGETNKVGFADNNITITVSAKDHAGNVGTTSRTFGIDAAKPELSLSYSDQAPQNLRYFKEPGRTAYISLVDQNFKADTTKVIIHKLNSKGGWDELEVPAAFRCVESIDKFPEWSTAINFATIPELNEGDYWISVECVDAFLNDASPVVFDNTYEECNGSDAAHYFTIDFTAPKLSVTYNNMSAQNGNYFKANRTATLTTVEHNWRPSDYVANIGAQDNPKGAYANIAPPTLGQWQDSGDTHAVQLPYTRDGKYTFSASYTDLAGNVGRSLPEEIFFIDTVAPVVPKSLSDIGVDSYVNGSGSEVSPYWNVTDNNLDISGVSWPLTSQSGGAKLPQNGSSSPITNGQAYRFQNFVDTKKSDDIYTLNVNASDKAGNSSSSGPLVFSVNRYGSTFDMSVLRDIDGGYFKKVDDLVFIENNPNTLKSYSVNLTHDDSAKTLVLDTDYRRSIKEVTHEWARYEYTVLGSRIIEDGRYGLTLNSRDEAGNVNSSADSSQEGVEISWAIDNSKPTAAVSGIENRIVYAQDTVPAVVTVTDNLKLKSAEILLNDMPIKGKISDTSESQQKIEVVVPAAFSRQTLKINYVDEAGNTGSKEIKGFLINSNWFVRFYQNTLLFFGSLVGLVLVIAGGFGYWNIGRAKPDPITE